jgi:ComEC/Rec2-related protein
MVIIVGWALFQGCREQLLFLFVVLLFGILHAWQSEESAARRLGLLINNSTSNVAVTGCVISSVKHSGKNRLTFFIEVEQLEWQGSLFQPRVSMFVHWEGPSPAYGDLLSFRATAEAPQLPRNPGEFNRAAWFSCQEIYTELMMDPSEPGTILSSGHGFLLKRWAIQWRDRVEKILELGIEGDHSVIGLIKGVLLGLKEDEALFEDFKLTGTMHLFAVSGLHVGMLVMMLWFFFKLLRLSPAAALPLTLVALFFYVMMTGCHIGSLRAAIMTAVVLGGTLLGRGPQIVNSLAVAAFLLLLFETELIFSMGWQFSFSVVLAIVLLTPVLERYFSNSIEHDPFLPKSLITPWQERWQAAGKHLAQLVALSIAAWVGALLPTVYYFHQLSFSSLGANVLAVPLTFLIMLTALLAIATGLFSSSGAIVFNNANWLFAKMLLLVVHLFALIPYSSCSIPLPSSFHPRLTLFALPGAQAALLQTEGKNWLINTGRAINTERTLLPLLEELGIKRLDGLLLTDQDPGCSGGASLLLEHASPRTMMAPSAVGRSKLFHHLLQHCSLKQQPLMRLSSWERLDFSKEYWGEIVGPSDATAVALKLHWRTMTIWMIPDRATAIWLSTHLTPELLHADVLKVPWSHQELLEQEPFLTTMSPKILILSDHFSREQRALRDEEREMLQHHGITLFSQEESGAVVIDFFAEKMKVSGFSNKQSFLMSSSLKQPSAFRDIGFQFFHIQ